MRKIYANRAIALLLCLAVIAPLNCAYARANLYLDSYGVSLEGDGSGRLLATFIVYGTKTMQTIGVQKCELQEKTGTSSYTTVLTDVNFYLSDMDTFLGEISYYNLKSGTYYRIKATVYAKGYDGGSGAVTITTIDVKCP